MLCSALSSPTMHAGFGHVERAFDTRPLQDRYAFKDSRSCVPVHDNIKPRRRHLTMGSDSAVVVWGPSTSATPSDSIILESVLSEAVLASTAGERKPRLFVHHTTPTPTNGLAPWPCFGLPLALPLRHAGGTHNPPPPNPCNVAAPLALKLCWLVCHVATSSSFTQRSAGRSCSDGGRGGRGAL
jgi:hypothetical protein